MSTKLGAPQFGTEGWRAVMGIDFSEQRVSLCTKALVNTLSKEQLEKGVVVGWDTRKNSANYAQAVADTLAQEGVFVYLFDRAAPTPACSFAARIRGAYGVMITASHNPPEWNGFKVKSNLGAPITSSQVELLESNVLKLFNEGFKIDSLAKKAQKRIQSFNPLPEYLASCLSLVDTDRVKKSDLKIVSDGMYGCGANNLSKTLSNFAEITEIRNTKDPNFGGIKQPEPIGPNLAPLKSEVTSKKANLGVAFDGDADRLGVVDANGTYLSTLDVFGLLTYHVLGNKKMVGSVVCTLTMSSMIERVANHFGAKLSRTKVGFKHIAPTFEGDTVIGGEESGGYAFGNHIPDRDGLASALMLIEMVSVHKKSPGTILDELQQKFGKFTYSRRDLLVEGDYLSIKEGIYAFAPAKIGEKRVVERIAVDGLKLVLEDGSWVGCRMSGTEPLLRVYAEGFQEALPEELVELLIAKVGAEGGIRTHTP